MLSIYGHIKVPKGSSGFIKTAKGSSGFMGACGGISGVVKICDGLSGYVKTCGAIFAQKASSDNDLGNGIWRFQGSGRMPEMVLAEFIFVRLLVCFLLRYLEKSEVAH